jgi:hypothetical protein
MSKYKIAFIGLIVVIILSVIWFFAQKRHAERIQNNVSIEKNITQ